MTYTHDTCSSTYDYGLDIALITYEIKAVFGVQLLHLLLFVRVRWATSEMSDFDLCIDLMLKYDVTVTTSPQESRQVKSLSGMPLIILW